MCCISCRSTPYHVMRMTQPRLAVVSVPWSGPRYRTHCMSIYMCPSLLHPIDDDARTSPESSVNHLFQTIDMGNQLGVGQSHPYMALWSLLPALQLYSENCRHNFGCNGRCIFCGTSALRCHKTFHTLCLSILSLCMAWPPLALMLAPWMGKGWQHLSVLVLQLSTSGFQLAPRSVP